MTGSEVLDLLCGNSTTQYGLARRIYSDTTYRALALQWLKLVYKDISNRQENWHWRFLEVTYTFNTVTDQYSYDFPGNIDSSRIFSLTQADTPIKLDYIPQELVDLYYPDPTDTSGNPLHYTIFGKVIRLLPIPDSAIEMTLRYIKIMSTPADDSTTLDIPDKYLPVVLDGLLMYCYRYDKILGDLGTQTQIYLDGIKRMQIDNNSVIDEIKTSQSHRTRYNSYRGEDSKAFPIDD